MRFRLELRLSKIFSDLCEIRQTMSSLAGIKYDQIEQSGDEIENDSQAGVEIEP